MIKHHDENRDFLTKVIKPEVLAKQLLDEHKFCKPLPTVKGRIWHLLGLLIGKFHNPHGLQQEMQDVAF